jgi:hypothetical protein
MVDELLLQSCEEVLAILTDARVKIGNLDFDAMGESVEHVLEFWIRATDYVFGDLESLRQYYEEYEVG